MKNSLTFSLLLLGTGVVASGYGCSSNKTDSGFTPSSSSSGGGATDSGRPTSGDATTTEPDDASYGTFPESGPPPPPAPVDAGVGCANLQCDIQQCEGGAPTSISGKVLDPAGNNPLYNVVVFIPNTQGGVLPLIPRGVNTSSCSCGDLFQGEEPIVDTLTLADGTFSIKGVPSGTNIPLVVQIGKWRKEIVLPTVKACQDNPAGNIKLPKNGSDGLYASIPNIAVSTGLADSLECLLTRVGIDEAEFSGDPAAAAAHVHVFQGSGGNTTANPTAPSSPTSLFDSAADLERYDIVMLSCEGSPTSGASAATSPGIAEYVNKGGRLFAEHYHYALFTGYASSPGTAFPEFANVATWGKVGALTNDAPYMSDITGVIETTLPNGNMFQEGIALKAWLGNVGALNASSELVVPMANARDNATVGSTNLATPWVQTDPSISPPSTQYFSWDMPFNAPKDDAGVPQYCGRAVYSDLHVSGSGTAGDYAGNTTVPTGCAATNKLSPDEDALEFILFDLSSCVTPIGYPPKPPPTPPPPVEAGTSQ